VVVLPRPLDCFALRLEGGEHVVRVILDYEVVDWAAFLAALWTGFDVDVRRTSLSAARQRSYRTSNISALRPAISTVSPGPHVMTARASGDT
jgi:hypothetical protein